MKRLLTMVAILYCWCAQAQLTVVTAQGPGPYTKTKREAFMDSFRHSTTIFILQYRDYEQLAAYEQAIKRSWTVTPYKIIRPEELLSYEGKTGYSFFSFAAFYTGKHSTTQHLMYGLWMPMLNKKGHFKNQYFLAQILLYPEWNKRINMVDYSRSRHRYDASLMNCVLDQATFYNWNATFLGGYLKTIDRRLKGNKKYDSWYDYSAETITSLKTDTLFIPAYTRIKEKIWQNAVYNDTTLTAESVHTEYPYPVQFITLEGLNKRVQSGMPTNYLVFTVDASTKYVDIYSTTSGLVYNHMSLLSWTFKNKDMAHITQAIRQVNIR